MKKEKINQKDLMKQLSYDADKGYFTWLVSNNNRTKIGKRAGSETVKNSNKKYREVRINGITYREHRLIWLYVYGEYPPDQIDHINGDGTDNRLENLRSVNAIENHRNVKKPSNNRSGIVGVWWEKSRNKWVSNIVVEGNVIYLGRYNDIFSAACVRKSAEIYYGFHKNHGMNRSL